MKNFYIILILLIELALFSFYIGWYTDEFHALSYTAAGWLGFLSILFLLFIITSLYTMSKVLKGNDDI